MSKRPRTEPRFNNRSKYVFVTCYDEPLRLLEVDLSLLSNCASGNECLLYKTIVNDAPDTLADGTEFWRSSLCRSTLRSLIESLRCRRLVVTKDVTVDEMLAVLEHQGIDICSSVTRNPESKVVCTGNLGFKHTSEDISASLFNICNTFVSAITKWVLLWDIMDAVAHGRLSRAACSALSNRIYICFADPPVIFRSENAAVAMPRAHRLCEQWPLWLEQTVIAIGIRSWELASAGELSPSACNHDAFVRLVSSVESDPLGPVFLVAYDHPRVFCGAEDSAMLSKGEMYARRIRSTVASARMRSSATLHGGSSSSSASSSDTQFNYAEAIILFAEQQAESVIRYSQLFSGVCAPGGNSAERQALSRALSQRKMRLVSWVETREERFERGIVPLVFPPHFRARQQKPEDVTGPACLVEIDRG